MFQEWNKIGLYFELVCGKNTHMGSKLPELFRFQNNRSCARPMRSCPGEALWM
jgi:hypothetical protein